MSRVPPPRPPAASLSFEIDGSDDILAEALAAVEQRERGRAATAEALELDLELDLSDPPGGLLEAPAPSHPRSATAASYDALGDPESWGAALTDDLDGPRPSDRGTFAAAEPRGHRRAAELDAPDRSLHPSLVERGGLAGRPAAAAVGSPRELLALRADNDDLRAELAELGAELREARRAEEAAHMAVQIAREAAAEQAAEAAALRAAEAAGLEEQGRLKAAAQRLLREKRLAEDQLRRVNERVTRAEDAKAAAEQAGLAAARTIAELTEQRARLERDLERAHERRKRELEEQRRRETTRPLKELLPVLDHMQLALAHGGAEEHPLSAGLRMIADQLLRSLQKLGMELISATPGAPFNPELHEALQRVETVDHPEGTVFTELQPGYTAEGRLLRAARVSVAVRPRAAPEPAPPGPADLPEPAGLPAPAELHAPIGATAGEAETAPIDPSAGAQPEAEGFPGFGGPLGFDDADIDAIDAREATEADDEASLELLDDAAADPSAPFSLRLSPAGAAAEAPAIAPRWAGELELEDDEQNDEADEPEPSPLPSLSPLDDPTLDLPPEAEPPDPSRA